MASSASEGEGVASAPRKGRKQTAKQKKEAELAEMLAAKKAAEEEDGPVLEEVQETHCIRHGNQRQRTRHGMKYTMYAAKFSPDGKLLLTSSSDKSACLWDLKTGREMANYEHLDVVRCAIFSPDGTHICTGCDDREARIWKVEEKPLIDTAQRSFKHNDWVVCVCYSLSGDLLCTVSRNSSVQIHDLSSCRLTRKASKRRTSAELATASLDIFVGADGQMPSRQGSKQSRLGSKRSSVHGEDAGPVKVPHDDQTWWACFSADAELLVTASGWERGNAIVFDVVSMDELLRIPHHDWVTTASFSPVGAMVLTTCRDKKARIFELPKEMMYGKALQDAKNRKDQLEQEMKEAQEGKKKLVISRKKQKELAEAAERAKLAVALHAKELSCFQGNQNWTLCATWSHDGKLICTGSDSGLVQIFDVLTGTQLIYLDQQEQILDIQWSPSDRKICVASLDSTARVYGGLQTLPTPEPPPKAIIDDD